MKIHDPKLRKLLEKHKSSKRAAGKKTEHKLSGAGHTEIAALRSEVNRLARIVGSGGHHAAGSPASPKRKHKAKKSRKAPVSTSGLRVPSLPADHPFNHPRKAGKGKTKKGKSHKPKAPNKRTTKRAKKTSKKRSKKR